MVPRYVERYVEAHHENHRRADRGDFLSVAQARFEEAHREHPPLPACRQAWHLYARACPLEGRDRGRIEGRGAHRTAPNARWLRDSLGSVVMERNTSSSDGR